MLTHLFTTPISRERLDPPAAELEALCEYLLELRAAGPGEQRSNRGGWHSAGNLFDPAQHRQFDFLREAVTRAVLAYFGESMGFTGKLAFALTGWVVINRPGDANDPHTHARNLLSGVFYPRLPAGMTGGEIVFMDPRLGLSGTSSDEMQRLGLQPPWDLGTVSHAPAVGDLLIFPSWLQHFVRTFQAPGPDPLRMVVSFNIAI